MATEPVSAIWIAVCCGDTRVEGDVAKNEKNGHEANKQDRKVMMHRLLPFFIVSLVTRPDVLTVQTIFG